MNPPPPERSADWGRPPLRERRDRERRVLAVGLAVSVLVHVLAVALIGDWLAPTPDRPADRRVPLVIEPPDGLRVVDLAPVSGEAIEEPERPDRDEDEEAPAVDREVVAAAPESADTVPADTRTAADRLAPRIVDPRLWRPMILLPREPTFEEVQTRIAEAVELLSDSALAAVEAAMRARDWTVTDADGGRWGISPGQLHLGDVTLPLPVFFVDREAMAAEAMWYELDQQLERTQILESFEDRVRAIRERREREREEGRNADNGGG